MVHSDIQLGNVLFTVPDLDDIDEAEFIALDQQLHEYADLGQRQMESACTPVVRKARPATAREKLKTDLMISMMKAHTTTTLT